MVRDRYLHGHCAADERKTIIVAISLPVVFYVDRHAETIAETQASPWRVSVPEGLALVVNSKNFRTACGSKSGTRIAIFRAEGIPETSLGRARSHAVRSCKHRQNLCYFCHTGTVSRHPTQLVRSRVGSAKP